MAQSDETKIAVLQVNIDNLVKKMDRVVVAIDSLPQMYLTQKEHVEFVAAVEKRFTQVEAEQRAKDNQNEVGKWIERLSIAGTTAIIVYLVNFYLTHGGALK